MFTVYKDKAEREEEVREVIEEKPFSMLNRTDVLHTSQLRIEVHGAYRGTGTYRDVKATCRCTGYIQGYRYIQRRKV